MCGVSNGQNFSLGKLLHRGSLRSFVYLAPETSGAGHCWTQDAGRTWALDCSDNALPMNSFAGDLREDYFKL